VKISPTAFLKFPRKISIGDNTFINHHCCIWAAPNGSITIGNDVLLGPNVCLMASNHGISLGKLIRQQPGIDAPIVIGNDVWIGANVVVLAGVTIGDGCVIGAGAVVANDLPSNTICVGIPAKVLRLRV
jgi:acetyltransferase-like isoleucine patch superfamily enzyme